MSQVIIDTLRNDAEYYGGVGKNYLSNSDIGALLTNPHDFRKTREDNKSFAEGRLFHQLLLEPHKALDFKMVDVSTRTTKEYKTFCEENNLKFALLKKEVDDVHKMVSVIKSNIVFFDEIYKSGNVYEKPGIAEIKGEMWKGKCDIETETMLIDLKTTSDINKFRYSAKSYNYDSQCFIYERLFGKPLVFFVIDKETHQLGIFRPTESFLRGGEAKVERAVDVYRKYFSKNATDDILNYYIEDTLD